MKTRINDNAGGVMLIPYWIEETLKRNKLPLATCLDFPKLKPLLSINDMIGFSAMCNFDKYLFGAEQNINSAFVWSNSIPEDQPEVSKYLWNSIAQYDCDESILREVQSRLFDEAAKCDRFTKAFAVHDLSPKVLGVVIYPGYFTKEGKRDLSFSLIGEILKVLYVYLPYHEVVKTPLYRRNLELLSDEINR